MHVSFLVVRAGHDRRNCASQARNALARHVRNVSGDERKPPWEEYARLLETTASLHA